VQADPMHAPDPILRHRVKNYRAGDLERNYTKLGIGSLRFHVFSLRRCCPEVSFWDMMLDDG
jgi:hypothetical protein